MRITGFFPENTGTAAIRPTSRAAIIVPSVWRSRPRQTTGYGLLATRQKSGLPLSPAVSCCLSHCSVRQRPEVGEHLRRFRRIHHALREEDADHSLCRIGVCRCAEAAVPTESAWGAEDFVALNVHRHSDAPAAIRAEKDFGPCALLRRELICSHQPHGGA